MIMSAYKTAVSFAHNFHTKIVEEKRKLPYNINIIDELHINENAHSRILCKLLLYGQDAGTYDILKSLINYIKTSHGQNSEFQRITVDKPHVTQEESRIDLWVRDTKYAIIFENKIYNAQDQEAQLSRYIEKTIAEGYSLHNIFVMYLSSTGQEPEDQSWGKYKLDFEKRYINLSFKDDIIKWLKDQVLPNVKLKDIYLQSAITQYIDYLEGLFFLRTIQNQMNMNLDKFLISEFGLQGGKAASNFDILQSKIEDLNEVLNAMIALQKKYKNAIIRDWQEKTRQLFPMLCHDQFADYTDVYVPQANGKVVKAYISEENNKLYCQIEYDGDLTEEERNKAATDLATFGDLLPQSYPYCLWKYLPYDAFDEVYDLFVKVTKRLLNMSQQKSN